MVGEGTGDVLERGGIAHPEEPGKGQQADRYKERASVLSKRPGPVHNRVVVGTMVQHGVLVQFGLVGGVDPGLRNSHAEIRSGRCRAGQAG